MRSPDMPLNVEISDLEIARSTIFDGKLPEHAISVRLTLNSSVNRWFVANIPKIIEIVGQRVTAKGGSLQPNCGPLTYQRCSSGRGWTYSSDL